MREEFKYKRLTMKRQQQVRGKFPVRSYSLEKQSMEERPADHFCFTHVALGTDFQDKHRERQGGVCGEGAEREKGFLGICAFTLKIKPSKNPVGKKKLKLAVVLGFY